MLDLGLIVADKNMDFALRGILSRHKSLGIRQIRWETEILPTHDGGVRTVGPEALARLHGKVTHGIIMLDWEGSGADASALDVEADLDEKLQKTWEGRAKSIVIKPELDIWIWGSDNKMKQILECQIPDLRAWLKGRGFELDANLKPDRPKEAIQDLLFELQIPRSSSLYQKITSKISLTHCIDPAFVRLRSTLQRWFG